MFSRPLLARALEGLPGLRRRLSAHHAGLGVALGFLGWGLLLCLPVLVGPRGLILGESGSDVIRGIWSMDHVLRGLPDPIWTQRVHVPGGAFALPLPFASSLLLSPLNLLLGSLRGYVLSCGLLLGLAGFGVAWLARELTGRWSLGALAGGSFMGQPMLLHAIQDGTPEHLAVWSLPCALAALLRAARLGSRGQTIAAGLLVAVVLFDSPYLAVQALLLGPAALLALLVIHRAEEREPRALRVLGWSLLVALPALLFVAWLYSGFQLSLPDSVHDPATVLAGNSVDLKTWWILERAPQRDVLGNMVPAYLPMFFLLPALLLGLLGLPRSLPWLLVALLSFGLALGTNPANPQVMVVWGSSLLGSPLGRLGSLVGEAILAANLWLTDLPVLEGVRFPRRWLLSMGLALSLAGALGLSSVSRQLAGTRRLARVRDLIARHVPQAGLLVAVLVSLLLAESLLLLPRSSPFPSVTQLPPVEFAEWLRDAPEGAVLQLPTQRQAPAQGFRATVPVYAGLPSMLASTDSEYFQILHRKPTWHHPSLLTVRPVGTLPQELVAFIRDIDDLTLPALQGLDPPISATEGQRSDTRKMVRRSLRIFGFRWVTLDLGAYKEPWLGMALEYLAPVAEQRRFPDGQGVLLVELAD